MLICATIGSGSAVQHLKDKRILKISLLDQKYLQSSNTPQNEIQMAWRSVANPVQHAPLYMKENLLNWTKEDGKFMANSTKNIIYLIECKKQTCKARYIGESERQLKERLSDHKQYIKSIFPTQATGEHFNKPGHSLSDLSITILEKVKVNDTNYRKERERFQIKNFNTYYRGLNRQP